MLSPTKRDERGRFRQEHIPSLIIQDDDSTIPHV